MVISLILGFSPRLPVSVCGTGTSSLLAAFLASVDSAASILIFCPHHISELSTKRTSLLCLPKCLDGFYHQPALPILLCHCLVLTLKVVQEYQPVVHRLRPSSPRLRSRLTLGGRAFPRKPWAFDGEDSHLPLATHASILSPVSSTTPLGIASANTRCSSTAHLRAPIASAAGFSPGHFRRRTTRLVSYYALFK